MSMKKFKKSLHNIPMLKAKKKSCWKNPVFLSLFILGAAVLIAVIIVGLVKWSKRDEDILDEDWLLEDDDDDILFFPSDDNFEIDEDE
ncbi:MAG: hypothetical protein LBE35_03855 [Clostridiales bacterium]|jgi:hypothetical protein|nr:hypothetical protein [Clostridiales bacterium]